MCWVQEHLKILFCIRKESHDWSWRYTWMRKPTDMTSDFSYWHNWIAVCVQILVPYSFAAIWYFKEGINFHCNQEGGFPCRSPIASEVLCLWISQHRKCDCFLWEEELCFRVTLATEKSLREISDCATLTGISEVP